MKQLYLALLVMFCVPALSQVPGTTILLDNFNRNDSVKVGVPAGSTFEYWLEYGEASFPTGCNGPSSIRLKTNAMEMSRYDWNGVGCVANTAKAANIEMTFKYPTVFATAPGPLEWYFNMQQSNTDPSGFNGGQDGVSFVVGCNVSNPASSPRGYAVVFGDGTTDRIRLVSFLSDFTNGAFTELLSVPGPVNKTTHMSIRVTYNPCNNEWSLRMRDDGASFADPTTITGAPLPSEIVVNSTFTNQNLPWIGGIWNHGSVNTKAKFDNVYIPDGNTIGSYVWNGSNGTDFQLAANWTPARNCVRTGDRLLFNLLSPANSVLTNVPSQSIRQLWISNNRTVTLKDVELDGAASGLTLTGAAGADLKIDAGSSLILDVSSTAPQDAMVISLSTGTTGSISGNLVFTNSTGSGANLHRLLAADATSITVNSGGMIKAEQLNGNPFGISGTANVVVFSAGSSYEHHDGADPFGLAAPSSKVVFNRGSLYRHFANSQLSLFGRTYANCEFNGNIDVINGSASGTWNVDTLVIKGTLQLTGSSNGQPVNTNIKGNLEVTPGAVFNYNPAAASTFIFNSNFAAQRIYNSGSLTLGHKLTVRLSSIFQTPQLYVENDIGIGGALQLSLGTIHLNGNIHMLSDAVHTASVMPVAGGISYGSGEFIVERYIPAHKAWQFLAVPTTTGQTTKDAWQEGNAPLLNAKPGYGTIITGHVPGNGFDIYTPSGPSMKTYNSVTNSWVGIANTDIDPIANKKGYMLMVRGDRSVTTYNGAPTSTILRTKGKVFSPGVNAPPYTTVVAGRFESIGNPYASAIDFNLVTKSGGVQNIFYVWDPNLTGGASLYGLGGYQTFTFNGTTYDVVPGGGSYTGSNRYIESGQAFFARCTTPNGNVTFTESCKVTGSNLVTRGGAMEELRTNLYVIKDGNPVLLDGTMLRFDESFDNGVGHDDAFKMNTPGESIAIISHDSILVAENRKPFEDSDTVFFKTERLLPRAYQLSFVRANLSFSGDIFLVDQWQATKTKLIDADTVNIDFLVTTDPASYAHNRFYLVFKNDPVSIPEITDMITIAPNPASDKINIYFKNMKEGKYRVELLDPSGRRVHTDMIYLIGSSSYSIPATALATGTYYFSIKGNGVKLIKQVSVKL